MNVHRTVFANNDRFSCGCEAQHRAQGLSTALGLWDESSPYPSAAVLVHTHVAVCCCVRGCKPPPVPSALSVRSRSRSFLHSRLSVREKGRDPCPDFLAGPPMVCRAEPKEKDCAYSDVAWILWPLKSCFRSGLSRIGIAAGGKDFVSVQEGLGLDSKEWVEWGMSSVGLEVICIS